MGFWFAGGWNTFYTDNLPFWVGTATPDSGIPSQNIPCSSECGFETSAPNFVEPQPVGNYFVGFSYDYCTLPCADISFDPESCLIPASQTQYVPCASMDVSDSSASGPNSYVMSVYAGEDTANGYAVY